MSQTENNRKPGKFDTLIKALRLTQYTIKITTNEKIFIPRYSNAVTEDIIKSAKRVYQYAWMANEINADKSPQEWPERDRLQKAAIRECNGLLPQIQIAKGIFHLEAKRIRYWGNMIIETRECLKKWNQSDVKRYK